MESKLSNPRARATLARCMAKIYGNLKSRTRSPYPFDAIICSRTMVQYSVGKGDFFIIIKNLFRDRVYGFKQPIFSSFATKFSIETQLGLCVYTHTQLRASEVIHCTTDEPRRLFETVIHCTSDKPRRLFETVIVAQWRVH